MKSTTRILALAEHYGGEDKRKITNELNKLRYEIKQELMKHINAGIRRAKNEYLQEYKPGQEFEYL